jgi:HTH-type transcriptional regulator/antitoxin HipB
MTPPLVGTTDLPGYVRRARRLAGRSQRALAAVLGISPSQVAKWETGQRAPSVPELIDVLALAGLGLAVVDGSGRPVAPMRPDAARDRGYRLFPAHRDVTARRTWDTEDPCAFPDLRDPWYGVPRNELVDPRRTSAPRPDDHPTRAELVAGLSERDRVKNRQGREYRFAQAVRRARAREAAVEGGGPAPREPPRE